MKARSKDNKPDRLNAKLGSLWEDPQDRRLIANTIQVLDVRYDLSKKIAREPGVEEIITQMVGRLANAFVY